MNNQRYVDDFTEPLLVELDRTKDKTRELVEKLKNKLIDEMEVNEKMRENHVKLEEKMKIEVEKNKRSETKIRMLEKELASKEEIIKMLGGEAERETGFFNKKNKFSFTNSEDNETKPGKVSTTVEL